MFSYESLNLFLVSGLAFGCFWACVQANRGHALGIGAGIIGLICVVVACFESTQHGPLFHPTLLDSIQTFLDPNPYMGYGTSDNPFGLVVDGILVIGLSGGWFLWWFGVSLAFFTLVWRFSPPEKKQGPAR